MRLASTIKVTKEFASEYIYSIVYITELTSSLVGGLEFDSIGRWSTTRMQTYQILVRLRPQAPLIYKARPIQG